MALDFGLDCFMIDLINIMDKNTSLFLLPLYGASEALWLVFPKTRAI
jgi:hypothetical protein